MPSKIRPVILVDSREQKPYRFEHFIHLIRPVPATLSEGDYMPVFYNDYRMIFERKSKQDLISTLTQGRHRFANEIERMASYDYRCLIVECSFYDLTQPYTFSRANPSAIFRRLRYHMLRDGLDVVFAGSRDIAQEVIVAKMMGMIDK